MINCILVLCIVMYVCTFSNDLVLLFVFCGLLVFPVLIGIFGLGFYCLLLYFYLVFCYVCVGCWS